ncbi:MAG TPA: LysM peptidoglycan-binding domain-containing protein [Mobilitalea sp.]|nr:LysM peptidoglycan-binding domain-containing protein [Mobilitalea sp.]
MIIHVVQSGETIDSIAEQYHVPVERLMVDNGIMYRKKLVPGQTIVIVFPEQTYTVKEGDTVSSIAEANGISLIQFLRNNPFLSERQYIYPGETLVISYNNHNGKIATNGFANPFIDRNVLKKTLPYLTYLTIFGNRITDTADIEIVDDTELIEFAKAYGVAPIMFLTTLTTQGLGSQETSYKILYDPDLVDRFIENVLNLLNTKGYYGVNITFQFINQENIEIYNNLIIKLVNVVKSAGYYIYITLSPRPVYTLNETAFEEFDYSYIASLVDGILFMSFNFGYSFGPPEPIVSVQLMTDYSKFAVTIMPPEKLTIGLSVIGYDWKLPYVAGISKANSLSINSAIDLAADKEVVIQFDEVSQTPFYNYTESVLPIKHIVWFIDARTVNGTVKLITEHKFHGINIWNIMYYYSQQWLVINSQYEIITVL